MTAASGLLLVATTGLIAAGCVTQRAQASDSDAAASPGDTTTVVFLERGACHGTCPVYSVHVSASGLVRFVGTRFVRALGADTGRVGPAAVAAMHAAFAARKFSSVAAVIESGAPSCGAYVADLPTAELRLRDDAGTHRVRWDEGCRDHPTMLDTLARLVDSVSGTSRWTTIPRP